MTSIDEEPKPEPLEPVRSGQVLAGLAAARVAWNIGGLPDVPVDGHGEPFAGVDALRLQTALDPSTGRPYHDPRWLTTEQIAGQTGAFLRADARPVEVSSWVSFGEDHPPVRYQVDVFNASQVDGLQEAPQRRRPMDEAEAAQTLRGLAEDAQLRVLPTRRAGALAGGQYRHDGGDGATLRVRPEGTAWTSDMLQGLCRHELERGAPHQPYGSLPDVDRNFVAGLAAMRTAQVLGLPFTTAGAPRPPEDWTTSVSRTPGRLEALVTAGDRVADTLVERFSKRQTLDAARMVESASVESEAEVSARRESPRRSKPVIGLEQAREERWIRAVNAFGPKGESPDARRDRESELVGLGARWARVESVEEGQRAGKSVCFLPPDVDLQSASKYLRKTPMTAEDLLEARAQFERVLVAQGADPTKLPVIQINARNVQRTPAVGDRSGEKSMAFMLKADDYAITGLHQNHKHGDGEMTKWHYVRSEDFVRRDEREVREFLQAGSWTVQANPLQRAPSRQAPAQAADSAAKEPSRGASETATIDDAKRERLAKRLRSEFTWGAEARTMDCAYAQRKGVVAGPQMGVSRDGRLCVPAFDAEGRLQTAQIIAGAATPTIEAGQEPAPEKKYMPGYTPSGAFHPVRGYESLKSADVILLAEGAATALSIDRSLPLSEDGTVHGRRVAVVACFAASNLPKVSEALGEKFSKANFVVCADDDYVTAAQLVERDIEQKARNATQRPDALVASTPEQVLSDMRGLEREVQGVAGDVLDVVRARDRNAGRRHAEEARALLGDRAVVVRPNFEPERQAIAEAFGQATGMTFREFSKGMPKRSDYNDIDVGQPDGRAIVCERMLSAMQMLADRQQPDTLAVADLNVPPLPGPEPIAIAKKVARAPNAVLGTTDQVPRADTDPLGQHTHEGSMTIVAKQPAPTTATRPRSSARQVPQRQGIETIGAQSSANGTSATVKPWRHVRATDRDRERLIDPRALLATLHHGLDDPRAPEAYRLLVVDRVADTIAAQRRSGEQVAVRPMALTDALRAALPNVDSQRIADVVKRSMRGLRNPNPASHFLDKQVGTPDLIVMAAGRWQSDEFTRGLKAAQEEGTLPLSVGVGYIGKDGDPDAVLRSLEKRRTDSGRPPIVVWGELAGRHEMHDRVAGSEIAKDRAIVSGSGKDFSAVRELARERASALETGVTLEEAPQQRRELNHQKRRPPEHKRSRGL